jgi:hypothetical protein
MDITVGFALYELAIVGFADELVARSSQKQTRSGSAVAAVAHLVERLVDFADELAGRWFWTIWVDKPFVYHLRIRIVFRKWTFHSLVMELFIA